MRMRILSVIAVIVLAGSAITAQAASVPAEVNLPALRTIQPYSLDEKTSDQVYLLVTGVANGKEISQRFPKEKSLASAPRRPRSLKSSRSRCGTASLMTASSHC